MTFGASTYVLGYAAGALSVLSPCVLPLVPILVAGALTQHRLGAWALGAGLALSFAAVGIFVATVGVAIGIDNALLRTVAGVLLIVFGAVMAVPVLQRGFAAATSRLASGGGDVLQRIEGRGWRGQFAVGALLGLVWTPCVGPTLGAAGTLASSGQSLAEVGALMLLFGLGAATPLIAIGAFSRRVGVGSRSSWLVAAERTRRLAGALLVLFGVLIVSGADKPVEAWLVEHSPDWLTTLTTRF